MIARRSCAKFVVLVVVAAACGCASRRSTSQSVLAEAAQSEFGSSSYGCADTIAVAKSAGVHYEDVVGKCLSKDKGAMHALFRLSKDAGLDAASSEGHAAVLGVIFRKVGDSFFAECLAAEETVVQVRVCADLAYDAGYDPPSDPIPDLRREFPKTFPSSYVWE
jgi:hypothetical protein